MKTMYFFEILTEQQQPVPQEDPSLQDDENVGDEDIDEEEDPASKLLEPIKRYYLIQKLNDLSTKLNQLNIENNVLNLIITFIDSFDYQSLVVISTNIIDDLTAQLGANKILKTEEQSSE